ncbi:MAG: hypothetical protein IJ124_04210 [Clostridia bacterium]|nr:hypothetical protein [Clostridia bacterium]
MSEAIIVAAVSLAGTVITVWANRPAPYLIDYDAPGVDITSEGPDDGDPWYEMGGETDADSDAHL